MFLLKVKVFPGGSCDILAAALEESVWLVGLKVTEPSQPHKPTQHLLWQEFPAEDPPNHSELFTFSPQHEPACEVILEAQ